MWEWRVFYNEDKCPKWDYIIKNYVKSSINEKRSDLYYNINSNKYGLKIRANSENLTFLELKVLIRGENGYEFWEKLVKIPISDYSSQSVRAILKDCQSIEQYKDSIIDPLIRGKYQIVTLHKQRRKFTTPQLTLERVKVQYKFRRWISVQLESHSTALLDEFLRKELDLLGNLPENMSYPRFLQSL